MNVRNIVTWVLILLIISLGAYLVWWTKTESFQCLSDPYVYSIKLLEESNEAPVSCMCSVGKLGGSKVILDNEGFHPFEISSDAIIGSPDSISKWNFSALE